MKVYVKTEPITLDYHLTLIKPEHPKSFQTFECDMQDYKDLMELQLQRDQLDTRLKLKLYKRIYGTRRRETHRDLQEMRTDKINRRSSDLQKMSLFDTNQSYSR